jgi:hypothetical protein
MENTATICGHYTLPVSQNPSNVLNLEVEVPYAPRNLSASVAGPTSILLSWQAPPLLRNRALLGFYLYRDGLVCAEIENPEATSYVDEGLSEGAYYYHVSALYDGAESALSNMAMAALGVPEPPVNLMATVEGSNVFLSWEQVQNTEMLSGFKVMRNGVEVGLIADPQQLSWADYGLANGNYSYAVRAVYGSIESGNSAAIEVVVRVPYSPVNLVGVVNADDVQLSWQMPELANDHTQYLIYRDGILIAGIFNPNIMIYTDLNLANGSYHYQVKAVYSGVESLPPSPRSWKWKSFIHAPISALTRWNRDKCCSPGKLLPIVPVAAIWAPISMLMVVSTDKSLLLA